MKSNQKSAQFAFLLTSLLYLFTFSIQAQDTEKFQVSDSTFRERLSNRYDITFDGENYITNPDVAAKLSGLHFYNSSFENVRGIEAFTSLTELTVDGWGLTRIDLSSNKALKKLYITSSVLDSIDLSANTALTHLSINGNLAKIDLSANTALTWLYLSNQLTHLDLSTNTALDTLSCAFNQLTKLDLSANAKLVQLDCSRNQITTLDISGLQNLKSLSCDRNQLSTLNLSSNPALEYLTCSYNQLTTLDLAIQNGLVSLSCSFNQLHSISFSPESAISKLECRGNLLRELSFWNLELDYTHTSRNIIYDMNQFPSYYNEIYPFEKNMILKLYQPLQISIFLIYHLIIIVLLFQKDTDVNRNRRMIFWIIIGNAVIMPVWYILFTESIDSLSLFFYLMSFGAAGMLIQLWSLVRKLILLSKKIFVIFLI
jgi:hypothetical protein